MNVELDEQEGNSDTSVERFELLEAVVRIAIQKYGRNRSVNPAMALHQLMENHILPYGRTVEGNAYRETEIYTESNEAALESFVPSLRTIFAEYGTLRDVYVGGSRLKKEQCMTCEQTFAMMSDAQMLNDDFGKREVHLLFCSSKIIVPDELETPCHRWLFFADFLEFLLRSSSGKGQKVGEMIRAMIITLHQVNKPLKLKLGTTVQSFKQNPNAAHKEPKLTRIHKTWRRRSWVNLLAAEQEENTTEDTP